MTEAEWLTCSDPELMRNLLSDIATDRKMCLFNCACIRRIWHLLKDARFRKAIETVERYVDGLTTTAELGKAVTDANRARRRRDDAGKAAYEAARYHPGYPVRNAWAVIHVRCQCCGSFCRTAGTTGGENLLRRGQDNPRRVSENEGP
jgi:hypothetical protein